MHRKLIIAASVITPINFFIFAGTKKHTYFNCQLETVSGLLTSFLQRKKESKEMFALLSRPLVTKYIILALILVVHCYIKAKGFRG